MKKSNFQLIERNGTLYLSPSTTPSLTKYKAEDFLTDLIVILCFILLVAFPPFALFLIAAYGGYRVLT